MSGYSGKSSSTYDYRTSRSSRRKSEMLVMMELLEEVEKCRQDVEDKKMNLKEAEKRLEQAEAKVKQQVNNLDPQVTAKLRNLFDGSRGSSESER
mgnify:FL=1